MIKDTGSQFLLTFTSKSQMNIRTLLSNPSKLIVDTIKIFKNLIHPRKELTYPNKQKSTFKTNTETQNQ